MEGTQRPSRLQQLLALLIGFTVLAAGCGDSEATIESGVTRLLFTADGGGAAVRTSTVSPPIERPSSARPVAIDAGDLGDYWGDELIECADAPSIELGGDVGPTGSGNLDSDLLGLLSEHGRNHRETFGGLWLDGEATGGLLLAVTDDVHRHLELLMADIDGEVWEAPFSVVLVPFSEAELESAAEVLLDAGLSFVDGATVDLERNRVVVELFNPTSRDVDALIAAVDPAQICVTVSVSETPLDAAFDVLPQAGGDTLLTCDEEPFPATALEGLVPLATSDHPAASTMTTMLESDDADWIVLSAEPSRAMFSKYDAGASDAGSAIEVTALALLKGGTWEVSGWTFGCDLKVGLPEGIGPVDVFADPNSPPDPNATSIDVLVSEVICTGGSEMGDRLLGPQVVETETEVILAFAAVKRPGQTYDCPTNPFVPITIELDAPLAGRRVVNGLRLPPSPIRSP